MNIKWWIEFLRLIFFLWPIIEKRLNLIDDKKEREKEREVAVDAIAKMADEKMTA